MDANLKILIDIATKGGPQAKQVVEELNKAAAQGSKDAVEALKQLNPELSKQTGETKKLEGATAAETEQTKKATSAKEQQRAVLKGVGLEFPFVAKAMGLLLNPLSSIIALLGTVIAMVKNYADSVRAAGVASAELGKAAVSAAALATAHADLAKATADFETQFAKISTDAKNAETALNDYIKALLLKQQLEQELADAQLGAELSSIEDNPNLSTGAKIRAMAGATISAAGRKKNRDDAALQAQADAESLNAHYAGQRAQAARQAAAGLNPAIATANTQAAAAATDAKGFSNAKERAEVADMLETVRGLMEAAKGGISGVAAYSALHPLATAQLKDAFPPQPIANIETQLLARKAALDAQAEQVAKLEKDKADHAKELADEKARLEKEAAMEETNRATGEARAGALYDEIGTRRGYRKRTEPITNATEQRKGERTAEKADEQFWREADQQEREWDDYTHGRSKQAPSFTVPVAAAIDRGNRQVVAAVSGILKVVENGDQALAEQIKNLTRNTPRNGSASQAFIGT